MNKIKKTDKKLKITIKPVKKKKAELDFDDIKCTDETSEFDDEDLEDYTDSCPQFVSEQRKSVLKGREIVEFKHFEKSMLESTEETLKNLKTLKWSSPTTAIQVPETNDKTFIGCISIMPSLKCVVAFGSDGRVIGTYLWKEEITY